mmetsp:Transcript_27576/g.32623  ORF Transcript_27576/g.32623 Transcript_27576/m.32623 type:complete len:265 (-) Transcript_27576:208-1002(-)
MMVVDVGKPKLQPIPRKPIPIIEPPLPKDWTSHVDANNGLTYYYHVPTGTTQWEFPTPQLKKPALPSFKEPGSNVQNNETNPTSNTNTALNKDYLALSKEYKHQRKYRDRSGSQPCLLCFRAPSSHIFFPCGHKCVCQNCMEINKICESGKVSDLGDGTNKWCFCPLCNEEIKKVSLYTGFEEQEYWNWVNEIKPILPQNFKQNFSKFHGINESSKNNKRNDDDDDDDDNRGAESRGRRGSGRNHSKKNSKKKNNPASKTCAIS